MPLAQFTRLWLASLAVLLIGITVNVLLIGYGRVGPDYPGATGPYHGPYPLLLDRELTWTSKLEVILFDWAVYAFLVSAFIWAGYAMFRVVVWAVRPR